MAQARTALGALKSWIFGELSALRFYPLCESPPLVLAADLSNWFRAVFLSLCVFSWTDVTYQWPTRLGGGVLC